MSNQFDIYLGLIGQFLGLMAFGLSYGDMKVLKKLVIFGCFIVNIFLGLVYVFDVSTKGRYGDKYTQYLQEAQSFYLGQRDFMKLGGHSSKVENPAGHVWHYTLVLLLHNMTNRGEQLMKLIHVIVHSLINYVMSELAYMYTIDKKNAQLITILMLASQRTRFYSSMMYSEQIAVLYLVVAIYLICWNRPMAASIFLSLSISVKREALYALSVFQAVLLLDFGAINFFKCLMVMLLI